MTALLVDPNEKAVRNQPNSLSQREARVLENSGSQVSTTGMFVVGKRFQVVCVYKKFNGTLRRNCLPSETDVLLL